MKIRELGSALLLTLLLPHAVFAQVVITEIMYDPAGTDSGREWIEVYNAGTSTISFTKWRAFENNANHNILAASGTTTLAVGTYAVIAQNATNFRTDYPNFSSELFHSAISLDNGGTTIALKDQSGTIVEQASYDSSEGALGDGNSLQRPPDDSAQFSPHTPTPGAALSTSVILARIKQATSTPLRQGSEGQAKSSATKQKTIHTSQSDNQETQSKPVESSSAQTASVAPPVSSDLRWLFALVALIIAASVAIVVAKHFKKQEWDIVEETPEDV